VSYTRRRSGRSVGSSLVCVFSAGWLAGYAGLRRDVHSERAEEETAEGQALARFQKAPTVAARYADCTNSPTRRSIACS
jgi:hypothetical protein